MKGTKPIFLTAFLSICCVPAFAADVIVPDLLSIQRDVAIARLEELGLRYELATLGNCQERLTVAKVQPIAGTSVSVNSVIILWINPLGGFPLPNLVGETLPNAQKALSDIGLTVQATERKVTYGDGGFCPLGEKDMGVRPGIEKMVPEAGTLVCVGSNVTVTRIHAFNTTYYNLKKGELCP